MQSLKGMGNKRLLKPVPRREKKHFNMIELLKAEEKKKKGGIGASTKAKSSESSSNTAKAAAAKPTASELLAVKLRKKEPLKLPERPKAGVSEPSKAPTRCSTTDDELEALFSAIDKEITDDPEAALDLLDIIEDNPDEVTEEMQEEIEVIKSNIYLPPGDDYEMQVEEEQEEEDAEMKEMLEMIENAKREIDESKTEELIKMMDKLEDDEYFEKLKEDVNAQGGKEKVADNLPTEVNVEEDSNKNKRRADDTQPEKEPSKKKPKDNKKKKALAVGGVSMFGGKDLFGGKNPFAARKKEESSEEEEEVVSEEESKPSNPSNGESIHMTPPIPPPIPSFNIAVQADVDEQPVSFDDLPSSTHVILSSNKHRAKLPSRRRPTGKPPQANGNGHTPNGSAHDEGDNGTAGNGHERLALPSEENDYDGDESEMSYSHIKRGRRSMKRRQPSRSSALLSPIAHKISDSDDKENVHSSNCDPRNDRLTKDDTNNEREKEDTKRLEEERKRIEKEREEQERKRLENERKQKELAEQERKRKEEEERKQRELEERRKAEEEKRRAEEAKRKAEEAKRKAEEEKRKTEEARLAEEARKKAEEEKRIAAEKQRLEEHRLQKEKLEREENERKKKEE